MGKACGKDHNQIHVQVQTAVLQHISKGVNGFNIYLLQGRSALEEGRFSTFANGCFTIKMKILMHLIIRGQFANH